jgi:hypothetical protein
MLERVALPPTPREWSRAQRIGFRFVFLYFALYNLPFPLPYVPGARGLVEAWFGIWDVVVPWVGRHLLGIEAPIRRVMTGSGDRLFDYVQVVCMLGIALLGTALWSWRARATSARRLHDLLRVHVRYAVGASMLAYGLFKVWMTQMGVPDAPRLMEPYGESSPMGLLWTFMGASPAYTMLAGAAEVLGGALLFWRRTTLAGAILLLGVMAQVVTLNFCYDVPVKLYSSHLWLMALFLAAPDLPRVVAVLRGLPVPAAPPIARRSGELRVIKGITVLWLVLLTAGVARAAYYRWGEGAPKNPMAGIYEAEAHPTWRRVAIGERRLALVDGEQRTTQLALTAFDGDRRTLIVRRGGQVALLTLRAEADRQVLSGDFFGEPIRIVLRPADASATLLLRRGFRWINEEPFNR